MNAHTKPGRSDDLCTQGGRDVSAMQQRFPRRA